VSAFTFSTEVYGALWEVLGLPPMPARIAVRQSGATLTERSRVQAAALAEAEWLVWADHLTWIIGSSTCSIC